MTGESWSNGRSGEPESNRLYALILLTKIVGVVGFVGLLVAAHAARGSDYGWRVGALAWFAGCGVAYVLACSKLPGGGRRWR